MTRLSKKLSFVFAVGLSLMTIMAPAKCSSKPAPCRGPACPKRAPSQKSSKGGCWTTTTTIIHYKNKGRKNRMIPVAPGSYHVHFERHSLSNGLGGVSFPIPQRSRTR